MTLRARLAVALALLAALSVVAVAAVSYAATARRLRQEVDASLVAAVTQRHARSGAICGDVAAGEAFAGGEWIVQCAYPDGRVIGVGPSGVPVDRLALRAGAGSRSMVRGPWTQELGGQPYRLVAVTSPDDVQVRVGRSLAETNRVLGSVRDQSILVGLGVIALAALAGGVIARRVTRPVTRLSAAADAVAASGRLDVEVAVGGRDEVGRLGRAFASMLAALTRSRDQQQRLVQDAGHELRTPLTSLRANIGTLRRHPDLAGGARDRLLGDLDSEARELSGLVDELVALAVDRYDDEPEQTVALDQLAERAADRARRRSGRDVVVKAEPAPVVGRPQALGRSVGNLLDNAVKFSPDHTPIQVAVRPGHLEVRDHGPGIAAEDLPYVFDRFYRAVGARGLPGSGLGLAIVRQVVQDAGGSVQAANHPQGGAVVTLRLPPAPPR
jgi:two-component system sensor histidine kinase MprB